MDGACGIAMRRLANVDNPAQVQALWRLRLQLIFLVWLVPLAALVFLVFLLAWAYRRHRSPSVYFFQGLEHGGH